MRIDPQTLILTTGVVYAAMPVTVWALLHHRHPARLVNLWCASGLLLSLMLVLYGLRGPVSDMLSVVLANAAGLASTSIQVSVLRMEGQRTHGAWPLALLWLAALLMLLAFDHWYQPLRPGLVHLAHGLFGGLAAWTSWQFAQHRHSRSARLMSLFFALTGLTLALWGLEFLLQPAPPLVFEPDLLFGVSVALSLISAVVVNLGYMGLALEGARAQARKQRAAMAPLHENQQALELAALSREPVASERARSTRLLAHEVRQPLHNAAVALQSGVATLARSRDASEVTRAIEQALAVIRRVSATLDNTVAATTLLAAQGRVSTADTDLQMLIELCLGDLPPEARSRVRIEYLADARSARLEPSLIRLALRNLLMNAALYAPSDTALVLRVLDCDQPLALVLEVADRGPGIADDLRELIFEEGVRGAQPTVPGYGLGLHVVKRVARLHGGSIEWRANVPTGSVFSLTLPQGDPG